jgi:hypothetical protein
VNQAVTVPGNAADLDSKVSYLAGLRLALTTAQKALSNHPTIATKKKALTDQLEMLMAVGEVVEQHNLFQAMSPMLQGIFGKVYGAGGITKRAAIERGWQFAKDLAISTKMTGLQIFQANLYAVGLMALKQNNLTNTAGLQGAIEALSTTYARLRPSPGGNSANYFARNSISGHDDFLSILWSSSPINQQYSSYYWNRVDRVASLGTGSVQPAEKQDLAKAIADLADHFKGQADPLKALGMVDRTFQSATQLSELHTDGYYFDRTHYWDGWWSVVGYSARGSIHDSLFLQNLTELAFDIARVNPTTIAGANPDSEWVETLWEGGSIGSAAVGMSEFLSGFAGVAKSDRRYKMGEALDYAGRLVKVAEAVDDPGLDATALKGDFLGHLASLGAAYVALSPNLASKNGFFLDTVWKNGDTIQASNELEQFLKSVPSKSVNRFLSLSTRLLIALKHTPSVNLFLRDPEFLYQHLKLARNYIQLNSESTTVASENHLWRLEQAKNLQEVQSIAQVMDQAILRLLADNSIGGSNDNSGNPIPFPVDNDDTRELKQVLSSTTSRYNLPDYSIFDIRAYDQDPTRKIVIINLDDGENFGKITNNTAYTIGAGIELRSRDERPSESYVLRGNQIYYYPAGVLYVPQVGDKWIQPVAIIAQPPRGIGLSLDHQATIKLGLEQAAEFYKPLGLFLSGAVYQWAYDLGGLGRDILSALIPDWRKLDQSVEEDLPKDPSFVAGRLLGNGAGFVTGILGMIVGGSGTVGGGSLCITGIGCLAGAPAIAASAGLFVAGAVTAEEALKNAIANASVLLSSGLNSLLGKESPTIDDSRPTQKDVTGFSQANKIKEDEAFAILEVMNRRATKKNGTHIFSEQELGKFFRKEIAKIFPKLGEKDLPNFPEAIIQKKNGGFIAVEVKNRKSFEMEGENAVLPKFRAIDSLAKEKGMNISEFHLYVNKDTFEGSFRGLYTIGKGDFIFYDGKILQINGKPIQIRRTNFQPR